MALQSYEVDGIRSALEELRAQGELVTVGEEIDPVYEVAALQIALDNGPAFLFERLKGYPGIRGLGNVFSRWGRIARLLGVETRRDLARACMRAIREPLAPVLVDEAASQDEVLDSGLDVNAMLPVLQVTKKDGARILGSGMVLIDGRWAGGGFDFSFKRINFRGPDWASVTASPGTHAEAILFKQFRDQPIPVTVNITASPAAMLVAAGGLVHSVLPVGVDEIAIAGALQREPIRICRARTVDAYALADAEWVIEGVITTERVWETDEAEELKKPNVAPFFPEWIGHFGRAWKSRKFQATAITHRRDPIFYTWLADSYDGTLVGLPLREACFWELGERLAPGLVKDVHIPFSLRFAGGVVFQVDKSRPTDEAIIRYLLMGALTAQPGLRIVVAVDQDVNIESAEDILWAIMSRADPSKDYIVFPTPSSTAGEVLGFPCGVGIDATVPLRTKAVYERSVYPFEELDLRMLLAPELIDSIRAEQSDYARYLASRRDVL